MNTIQRSIASVRDLRHEEIDLVGGAYSTETTYTATFSTFNTPNGSVTVQDDAQVTGSYD